MGTDDKKEVRPPMNKDERKEFEAFMFGPEGHELHGKINSAQMSANAFAWRIWQAARSTIDAELVELLRNQAGKNYVITIENRDNVNEVFVHYGEGRLDYVFRDYYGSETYVEGMTHSEAYMAALSAAIKAALAKHKGKD